MTSIRSFVNKLITRNSFITVVSGLPRSGTSMMMSALKAGGMDLLVDGVRRADDSNPRGYYEYEPAKKLPKGMSNWLDSARGKAVKIISALLIYLPDDYQYRIIFMERNIDEILSSQQKMLIRNGKEDQHPISNEALRHSYQQHLAEVTSWLDGKRRIQCLKINFNEIISRPDEVFREVSEFLDQVVNPEAMASVVEPALYREQK